MKRLLLALLIFCGLQHAALAASCSSYPFTLQNNTTADATQVMANFNNVRNCVINNAAGSGVNTDITSITGLSTPLSVAQGGTPVFIGGTSTGSGNAQVVASTNPIGYSLTSGYRVTFTAGFTNTTAATLNVNSTGATAIRRNGAAGLEALTGGEIVAGNIVEAIYDGTFFVLLSDSAGSGGATTRTNIATGATVDLGTVPSHNARITSSAGTITSFGSTAVVTDPIYLISFAGANTLTYNASSLIIPGSANITTAADDTAVVEYLGSGNWQVLSYTRRTGAGIVATTPLCGASTFRATNNSGTPNTNWDMTALSTVMVDTTGVTISATSVSVTVNATTTGANGLDVGSLANNTWYYGWLISNGNTTAGLLSTSATAPTMPSGYTYKCQLSSVTTNGSAIFYRIQHQGRQAQYVVNTGTAPARNIANGIAGTFSNTNPTLAAVSVTAFVPTTAIAIRLIGASTYGGGSIAGVLVAPTVNWGGSGTGPAGTGNQTWPYYNGAITAGNVFEMDLEGTSVAWASSAGGGAISIMGWTEGTNAN